MRRSKGLSLKGKPMEVLLSPHEEFYHKRLCHYIKSIVDKKILFSVKMDPPRLHLLPSIPYSFHLHLFQFESPATGEHITRIIDKDGNKEKKKTELSYKYTGKCIVNVSENNFIQEKI